MPELPEVETVVRDLRAAGLAGREVRGARVRCARLVSRPSAASFARRVRRQRIRSIGRRAKFIVMPLSGGDTLIAHLGMTGQMRLVPSSVPRDVHEHLWLVLDRRWELRFHDPRKFGRWWLVRDPGRVLGRFGPEPLDARFSPRDFAARISGRRRQLKPLLLDQTFLAGIGNIYADEALWEARLHPKRLAHTLSGAERAALYRAIRKVLRHGIRFRGTSLGSGEPNFYSVNRRRGRNQFRLKVYQRTGRPCLRCGAAIARLIVGQRGTHICPRCQVGC